MHSTKITSQPLKCSIFKKRSSCEVHIVDRKSVYNNTVHPGKIGKILIQTKSMGINFPILRGCPKKPNLLCPKTPNLVRPQLHPTLLQPRKPNLLRPVVVVVVVVVGES